MAFNPTDTSRPYLVECRVAITKKPANGWQVEQAVVLQLAEKESTLKSAERELLKVDTPKDHKRARKPKRLFDQDDSPTPTEDKKRPKAKLTAQKQAEEEVISENNQQAANQPTTNNNQSPGESSSNGNHAEIRDLQNQVKALKKENSRLRKMLVKEIPSLLADMREVITKNNPAKDFSVGEVESVGEEAVTPCKPSEVKLGNDGDITVSAHCWETAKAQKTANAMARVLLMGLFSVDVLLKSNLTGGINKIDPTAERRQALDGNKLQALLCKICNIFRDLKGFPFLHVLIFYSYTHC
uniref:uncharacterized protein LOC109959443 isoform X2 n=1 Tax=Monopterus albus TaxID=43700 RepID=UPI0009B44148|nr:uncharacterized protein LOC109959443 isoform X2 [Monopterus albus]